MKLQDFRRNPIEKRAYTNGRVGCPSDLGLVLYEVYEISDDGTSGKARSHKGEDLRFGYPQGLSDSSRVDKGILDPTTIRPLRPGEREELLEKLINLGKDVGAKIRFLGVVE